MKLHCLARRTITRAVLGSLLLAAAACAAPLTKGPYLQAPGQTGMTIMWETMADEAAVLHLGEGAVPNQAVGPIRPAKVASANATFYVYEHVLTNLQPGRTYRYEVVVGEARSGVKQFRTFNREADRVRFIAYGDTRTNPDKHAAVAAQFRRLAPDAILHSGDLVAKGTQHELWAREFFDPLRGVIDEIPMLPSIGNHEQDGANYLAYFHQPGGQRFYYSCDIGPMHVLTLDFRSTKPADAQFEFVRADLKATRAPWKLVLLHVPMFNFGGHQSLWGHEHYLPLFRETKVDLVVAGHSHLYERFRPLAPRGQPGAWAIQHVTTGGGGAPLARSVADPSLVVTKSVHHFVLFDVSRDRLDARTLDLNGQEIDRFSIRKEGGRQTSDYLAQVYAEEDVVAAVKRLPPREKRK